MTEELQLTQNPVIDNIIKRIFNELMRDKLEKLDTHLILDLLVSIRFFGRFYNSIQNSYIVTRNITTYPWNRDFKVFSKLYVVLRRRYAGDLEKDEDYKEYRDTIVHYLNRTINTEQKVLQQYDAVITKTIKEYKKWSNHYIYRYTVRGPYIDYYILFTNVKYSDLKSADELLAKYKKELHPMTFCQSDSPNKSDVMFTLVKSYTHIPPLIEFEDKNISDDDDSSVEHMF